MGLGVRTDCAQAGGGVGGVCWGGGWWGRWGVMTVLEELHCGGSCTTAGMLQVGSMSGSVACEIYPSAAFSQMREVERHVNGTVR